MRALSDGDAILAAVPSIDSKTLRGALSPASARALDAVVAEARRRGIVPYLVGGAVRDLLLGRPLLDLDITLEGDAPAIAEAAAGELGGRVVGHRRFGTATIAGAIDGEPYEVDLVTARKERYARPGALPRVSPGTVDDDLRRRDFSIHAIAFALDGPDEGLIVDPTGGESDLRARRLRVLHDRSFIEDPTRILRAARYAARLGFELDPHTRELAIRDAPLLAKLSGARIHNEVGRLLAEDDPAAAIALAGELGALAAIDPGWQFTPALKAGFDALHRDPVEGPDVRWAILGAGLRPPDAEVLASQLSLPKRFATALSGAAALAADTSLAAASPSALAEAVERHPLAAVQGAALAAPNRVRLALRRYLDEGRDERPLLTSADLIAAGVPRGPELRRIGDALLRARRDGLVSNREDELALVRRELAALGKDAPDD